MAGSKERAALAAEADRIIKEAAAAERASKRDKKGRTVSAPAEEPDLPVMAGARRSELPQTSQVRRSPAKPFNLKGVADVLIDAGLNPAEEILRVMPELDPDVKARMMATLLEYIQPKLRAIEMTGKNGGPIELSMTADERAARIAELQAKLHGAD